MMKLLNKTTVLGWGTGREFSLSTLSPWFTYQDPTTSTVYQQWYDDPESLSAKYALTLPLRGIVMWHADALDYSDDATAQKQTGEMWDAINEFI